MATALPNPALEGYRTAHKQNSDGSYKYVVTSADLVAKKDQLPDTSRRIDRKQHIFEPEKETPRPYRSPLFSTMSNMGERKISERMEEAFRLRHHDFGGKTLEETASIMGIKIVSVKRLLWSLCKVAPQLFPILTPLQARAWHLWHNEGMPHNMIADTMGVSGNASRSLIKRVKKKFKYHHAIQQRMLVMDPKELERFEIGGEIVNIF